MAVTNIEEAVGGVQLELPFDGVDHPALDAVVDAVRDRYGSDALQRAALLEAGEELEAYLMPFDRHPR